MYIHAVFTRYLNRENGKQYAIFYEKNTQSQFWIDTSYTDLKDLTVNGTYCVRVNPNKRKNSDDVFLSYVICYEVK